MSPHQGVLTAKTLDARLFPRTSEVAMSNSEPWVTIEMTAKHLAVSQDTIRRWVEQRGLPAHRAGRFWRLKLSEVDEWVRDGGCEPDGREARAK